METYTSIQTSLTTVIIVGLFFIGLGYLNSKKTINNSKYIIGNRDENTFSLTTSLAASALGAWILFGPASAATWGGFGAVIGYALGTATPMLLLYNFGPKIRKEFPKGLSLTEFIKKETNNYDCVIIPDISNIINLIKTENIFIYALIQNHNVIACYIFRDPSVNYDNNKAIESTCSIFNNKYSKDVFINGFKQSYIKCREKIDGKCLLIEDIGNNNIIINNLLEKNIISFIKSPTAFFLYNYATYSCNNNKSFFIY